MRQILKKQSGRLIITSRKSQRAKKESVVKIHVDNEQKLLSFGFTCATSNVSSTGTHLRKLAPGERKRWVGGWLPELTVCCVECSPYTLKQSFQQPSVWQVVAPARR